MLLKYRYDTIVSDVFRSWQLLFASRPSLLTSLVDFQLGDSGQRERS